MLFTFVNGVFVVNEKQLLKLFSEVYIAAIVIATKTSAFQPKGSTLLEVTNSFYGVVNLKIIIYMHEYRRNIF